MRCAGPWPGWTTTTRRPSSRQPRMSRDRALDVAAVGVGRGLHRLDGTAGRQRRRLAEPRSAVVGEAERAHRPPGLARREGVLARRRRARGRTRRRGRWAPCRRRPRPPSWRRGTPRWSRPGRGRGVRTRSGSSTSTWVSAGIRSTSSSISSTSAGASDSMPSTAMPAAILSVSSSSCGCCSPELGGAPAYVVGEQQLAARRRPEPLDLLEGALVGDREGADLLDVVAPELHPQRVLLGGREDVDDAAADGELAALLDQVDAGVRRVRQPAHDVVEVGGVAGRAARPARGRRGP